MGWFSSKKDPKILARYNRMLVYKLINSLESLSKTLSFGPQDDYLKKNDTVNYARGKFLALTEIKNALENSKLFSRDIKSEYVPIKESYVHLYKMIFDKKRDKYSYYDLLLRFLDGKSEGDLPRVEGEIIKELESYRDDLAERVKIVVNAEWKIQGQIVLKEDIDAINSQFDVSSQFSKIAGRITRSNWTKILVGVLIIGAMCLSVAEPKAEDNKVASQTEHVSDSTNITHNFHK